MNAQMFATLSQIQRDVAEIKSALARGGAPASGGASHGPAQNGGGPGGGSSSSADGAIADDRDLDGEHGDVTVKYDPKEKYWSGESFAGYRFSECPPEYLDAMAKYLDACAYMAEKDPDEKRRKGARYKRMDAARARGWARRIRANGGQAPARQAKGGGAPGYCHTEDVGAGNLDDLPF